MIKIFSQYKQRRIVLRLGPVISSPGCLEIPVISNLRPGPEHLLQCGTAIIPLDISKTP